ncbi:hypothetical protein BJY01DRAFT_255224 [Aspergillus pseudoustus]|uniref:Xylanolytic transcriptional activator xlnR n=1 Tax=Aspergillus pseudoustus TaxID=1810923 RepID=A0ABR4IPL9_9EURO
MSFSTSATSPNSIRNNPRTQRACDRCNRTRTRCSGGNPCQQCLTKGYTCQYERIIRRRGPKPGRRTSTWCRKEQSNVLVPQLTTFGNNEMYLIRTEVDSPPDDEPGVVTPELEAAEHEVYKLQDSYGYPKTYSFGASFRNDQLLPSQLPYDVAVSCPEHIPQDSSDISNSQFGYANMQSPPSDIPSYIAGAHRPNKPPEPNVDDVLSYTLLALVEWRTHPRENHTGWWAIAINLVKQLGYQSESRILEQTSLPSPVLGEAHEECRRAFWLVYTLDKYLALCFQEPVRLDSHECEVLAPLPERIWRPYDMICPDDIMPPRTCTPPTRVSGTGFFEYFLPVMVIFAKIMAFQNRKHQLLPGTISDDGSEMKDIHAAIKDCDRALKALQSRSTVGACGGGLLARPPFTTPPETPCDPWQTPIAVGGRLDLTIEYTRHILCFCDTLVRKELLEAKIPGKDRGWIALPSFFSIPQRL